MWKRMLLLASMLTVGAMTGCAARGGYATGYVAVAPPVPRREVIGVAPGRGFVWVGGFWDWRGGAYGWVPGRWERPPHPHARWVPGRWERRHNGYYLRRGHWR